MQPLQRVTAPTVEVLRALLDAGEPVWGLRLVKATGRPAGSVYPILSRLEESGWLVGEWEADSGRDGPRRRLYRFTSAGEPSAREVVAAFEARRAPVSLWSPVIPGGAT